MSRGSFAEKLTFFVAENSAGDKIGAGGGREDEDIEILEPTLEEALAMVATGEIIDAKTTLLPQYARLFGLMRGNCDARVGQT
jgi:hypothetical protein